jgi:ADP-heptose:LPS heptosyltransferase
MNLVEPPRLVVLRALNLGDLLVAVPALRALRRAFPDHELILVTQRWLQPVVELIGVVDRLLPTVGLDPLPGPRRPDVAVNLHGAGPESHRVLDALRPVRRIGHAAPGWPGPPWRAGVHERRRWTDLLLAHGLDADPDDLRLRPPATAAPVARATVVHVGASYPAKQWPVQRFAEVAAALRLAGHEVVLTGSEPERPRALAVAEAAGVDRACVLAGRTGLDELVALLAEARLVISGDTGAAHLASAYRVPSVVLFGPVPSSEWGPPAGGPHRALRGEGWPRGDPFADRPDPALLGVTVSDVLDAAAEVLRPGRKCGGED